MKELAEVLSTLFRKISDLFDIFDLSFFVSGVFVMVPLGVWFHSSEATKPLRQEMNVLLWAFALMIATYVAGLVCFACGRAVRMLVYYAISALMVLRGKREHTQPLYEVLFHQALKKHGLNEHDVIRRYLETRAAASLYTRAWAKLRETPGLINSYNHVKRYWIMAATYDGLGFALAVWIIAINLGYYLDFPLLKGASPTYIFWVSMALLAVVGACFREGVRLVRNQVEELVATLALLKDDVITWVPSQMGLGVQHGTGVAAGPEVAPPPGAIGQSEMPPPPKPLGSIKG